MLFVVAEIANVAADVAVVLLNWADLFGVVAAVAAAAACIVADTFVATWKVMTSSYNSEK